MVSNPEFLKEGAAIDDFLKPDRVVDRHRRPASVEALMSELYEPFVRTGNPILVMDLASAELTKYAANAMLATRISFMNEIANLCDRVGADVGSVRMGMGTDERIGSRFLFPGVGYGGSCFPKDVKALMRAWAADAGAALNVVEAVERANEAQKTMLLPRIEEHLGRPRGQGGRGLGARLQAAHRRHARGAGARHDRGAAGGGAHGAGLRPQGDGRRRGDARATGSTTARRSYDAVEGADALVAGHGVERVPRARLPAHQVPDAAARPIFDGRNIYNPQTLRDLGFHYQGIGRR